jgi:hypothetical protein
MPTVRAVRRREQIRPRVVPDPVREPVLGRVLILSAMVGQGHEGAARELGRRLRSRGVDADVRDLHPARARR